ncbi:MAG: hypothetical protein JWN98_2308 [Abditibacteriota bacterium]|nr:hypothetical protein [Abditibacteriota bacterium]
MFISRLWFLYFNGEDISWAKHIGAKYHLAFGVKVTLGFKWQSWRDMFRSRSQCKVPSS